MLLADQAVARRVAQIGRALASASTDAVVLFGAKNGLRTAVLNKPAKLNALDLTMISLLTPQYLAWKSDPTVKVIVLKGAGEKAFCAGGDVAAIAQAGKTEGTLPFRFFAAEYRLDHLVATVGKPHVAFIDGIVMGGGVGLSVHGPFRVATERSVFAMPETALGLFPDVGGTYFLPRLRGELGMFLALTGQRLKGKNLLDAGIATHYVPAARLPAVEERLATLSGKVDIAAVNSALAEVTERVAASGAELESALGNKLSGEGSIDWAFGADSVESIQQRLRTLGAWGAKVNGVLDRSSPTSLKVTYRQVREGRRLTMAEAFRLEYRLASHAMRPGSDFYEGVRAILIDKDNKPVWNPATLAAVSDAAVDAHFAPVPEELDLNAFPPAEFYAR